MQFTFIVTILSAVVAVVAQGASAPPQCAIPCLTSTPTNGCNVQDIPCLCRNKQFIDAQTGCITSACTDPSDLRQAQAFAMATCLSVSVTLSTPSATGTITASSSGAASATSPSLATSTASTPTPSNAASVISPPIALLAGVAACALAL